MEDTPMLFVGIDVSKLKHDVAIMDEQKKIVRHPFLIRQDRQGFDKLLEVICQEQYKTGVEKVFIGMEATAQYWKNLYHFLLEQPEQFHIAVINPFQTRSFARAGLRRAKTDSIDSRDIASFLVEKRPRAYTPPLRVFECIVDLDRQIHAIKKQKTRTINRLRNELFKVAPEIEQNRRYILGAQFLALLEAFPTAEQIEQATMNQLKAITYGKRGWHLPDSFIRQIKTLVHHSIGYKRGAGSELLMNSLIRQIRRDNQEIEILKAQLLKLYATIGDEESLLTTIGHFSKETAVALEASLGDVRRFPNHKAIVAYYGMNPIIEYSGTSRKRKSRLQKKGDGYVRARLYMATISMIRRKKEPIYSHYTRLVEAGKPKMLAVGACMRKLLVIIYYILKNNTPFDEKYGKKV